MCFVVIRFIPFEIYFLFVKTVCWKLYARCVVIPPKLTHPKMNKYHVPCTMYHFKYVQIPKKLNWLKCAYISRYISIRLKNIIIIITIIISLIWNHWERLVNLKFVCVSQQVAKNPLAGLAALGLAGMTPASTGGINHTGESQNPLPMNI